MACSPYRPLSSVTLVAGAAAASAAAAPTGVVVVRLIATDQPARVNFSGVATATSTYLAVGREEYFTVGPGDVISAIRAGTTDSNLNITFMTR